MKAFDKLFIILNEITSDSDSPTIVLNDWMILHLLAGIKENYEPESECRIPRSRCN
jgi:hypothetical protein